MTTSDQPMRARRAPTSPTARATQSVRWALIALLSLAFLGPVPTGDLGSPGEARAAVGDAEARGTGKRKRSKKRKRKRKKRVKKRKVCRRHKGKRRCRWVPVFQGHGVAKSSLRTEPVPRPSGDIHVYAVNFREELTLNIYTADGDYDDDALAKLDHLLRCRRTGDERAVDPRLYAILSTIYEHFGRQRIDLVSGFRNQTNEKSRHYHASAMDIRVPGVSTRTLYQYAQTLDTGDMGIGRYPNSDFVHVDFRAPGEKSYRWTDYSGPSGKKKKKKKRKKKRRKSKKRK